MYILEEQYYVYNISGRNRKIYFMKNIVKVSFAIIGVIAVLAGCHCPGKSEKSPLAESLGSPLAISIVFGNPGNDSTMNGNASAEKAQPANGQVLCSGKGICQATGIAGPALPNSENTTSQIMKDSQGLFLQVTFTKAQLVAQQPGQVPNFFMGNYPFGSNYPLNGSVFDPGGNILPANSIIKTTDRTVVDLSTSNVVLSIYFSHS